MVFRKLKSTLGSAVLAASIALAPATSKAMTEEEFMQYTPSHMRWASTHKAEARAMVLGTNVLIGCLKSGIGYAVHDKNFFEGCAKGSLAGAIAFAGEYTATFSEYPAAGAVGKLVHDFGISMSDNAMRGENMLSQYQTDIGPVNLTFRDGIKPDVQFTLMPAVGLIKNIVDGNEFDWKDSLSNLTFVFKMEPVYINGVDSTDGVALGYSKGNILSHVEWDAVGSLTLSHEMNHALFWSKLRFTNDIIRPVMPDVIYRWWNVGQDLSFLGFAALSYSRGIYYYNPVELEAFIMQRKMK